MLLQMVLDKLFLHSSGKPLELTKYRGFRILHFSFLATARLSDLTVLSFAVPFLWVLCATRASPFLIDHS